MRKTFGVAVFLFLGASAQAQVQTPERCVRFVIEEHREDTWMLQWSWFNTSDHGGENCTPVADPRRNGVTEGQCAAALPVVVDGTVVAGQPVLEGNLITEYRVCFLGKRDGGEILTVPQEIFSPFVAYEVVPKVNHIVDYPDGTRTVPLELRPLARVNLRYSATDMIGAQVRLATPSGEQLIEIPENGVRKHFRPGEYRVLDVQFIPGTPKKTKFLGYGEMPKEGAVFVDSAMVLNGNAFALNGTKVVELLVAR